MWFGREGSHGVCRVAFSCCVFQTRPQHEYIFMYAIHEQHSIEIMQIVLAARRKKQEEKDNKKAS